MQSRFHLVVASPVGTTTFPVKANSLDAALRIAKKAYPEAEPMIGPMSRTYYKCCGA